MSEITTNYQAVIQELNKGKSEQVTITLSLPTLFSILSLIQSASIDCRGIADHLSREGESFVNLVTDLIDNHYPAVSASIRQGWEPSALLTREEFDQIVPFDGEITGLEPYPTDLL